MKCRECGTHGWDQASEQWRCAACGTPAVSVVPRVPKFYLCFLDFETTGLDPQRHEPIEVAAVVTDDRLNELGRFESLIDPVEPPRTWEPAAYEMHLRSGLFELCLSGLPRRDVAARLFRFLSDVLPNATVPLHLAGNSVHFDRGFLRAYFPAVESRFHHRHLDVSSLRMAGEIFTDAAPLGGEKPHRAMADVLRSIQELHHWRNALQGP